MTTLPSVKSCSGIPEGQPRRSAPARPFLQPSSLEAYFEQELRRIPLRDDLPDFDSPGPAPGNPPPTHLTKVGDSNGGLLAPATDEKTTQGTLKSPGEMEQAKTAPENPEPEATGRTDVEEGQSETVTRSTAPEKNSPENQPVPIQTQPEKGEKGITGDKTSKPKVSPQGTAPPETLSESAQLGAESVDENALKVPSPPDQGTNPAEAESAGKPGTKPAGFDDQPPSPEVSKGSFPEKTPLFSRDRNSDTTETSVTQGSARTQDTSVTEGTSHTGKHGEAGGEDGLTQGGEGHQSPGEKSWSGQSGGGQERSAAFVLTGGQALRVADRNTGQRGGSIHGVSLTNQPVLEKSLAAVKEVLNGARRAIVEQIASRLSGLKAGGTVTVSLEPAELGTVLIRFTRKGEGWEVKLMPERPEVAGILATELPRLEALLAKMHDPVRVDVSVGGEGQSSGQGTAETPHRGASSSAGGTEAVTNPFVEPSPAAKVSEEPLEPQRLNILT